MSSCRAKETVERVGIHCQRVDQDLRVVQVKATMCHRVMGRRRPSKVSNGSTNLCSLNKHKPSILRVMLNLSLSFTHFFLPRRLSNYPFLWLFSGSTQSMASCAHGFMIFPGHASTDGRVRGFAIRPENFRGQPHQRSGDTRDDPCIFHTIFICLCCTLTSFCKANGILCSGSPQSTSGRARGFTICLDNFCGQQPHGDITWWSMYHSHYLHLFML